MSKMNSQKDVINFILFDRIHIRLTLILLAFVATVAGLAVPYYQRDFMTLLSLNPLLICTGLALLSFILLQATNYLGQREALFAQKKLAEKLYHHILHLKTLTTSHKSIGEMVALYATDIPSCTMWLEQTIPFALTTAFPLIMAPIFLNLVYEIPYSLTLGLIFCLVCFNLMLARRQSIFFYHFKILAGQRMGLVNEWIQNIKSLKTLGWINSFELKIIKKRQEETSNRISMVTNGQVMNSVSSNVTFWLNLSVIIFVIFAFDKFNQKIDLIAIMWVMGVFLSKPLRQLPWFFTMMFDAWTSIRRLGEFFQLENKLSSISTSTHLETHKVLHVKNLNLRIGDFAVLKNINLEIKKSEIVALVGPIGSGKSILLKSLINETPFTADQLEIKPYCYLPQEPFVLSGTLTENIAFEYIDHDQAILKHSEQAQKALDSAQFDLNSDRINNGLQTVIGERGLNISGGQKQRLNLARLFYNPLPLFLLDDPFSAVDVGTEKKLVDTVLSFKNSGHSFLIITQRYDFLKQCDRIIYLESGEIKYDGTYSEFIKLPKYLKFVSGEFQ